jgi:hypothetical protein
MNRGKGGDREKAGSLSSEAVAVILLPYLIFTFCHVFGEEAETSTDFQVKRRKSARNRGIDHSESGKTAPYLMLSANW